MSPRQVTCFSAAMSLLLMAGAGCAGRPILTADDVIAIPGQRAVVSAFLEERYIGLAHSYPRNLELRFFANGRELGQGLTDNYGRVTITGRMDPPLSRYEVRAQFKGRDLRAAGRVFHWSAEKTIVAVDIDETISDTDYSDLFLADFDKVSPPIPGSPEVMRALARDYHILYFSARPQFLTQKTQQWLRDNRFPPGPVVHASSFEACLKQEQYKREMLTRLRRQLPNILVGIGDKRLDDNVFRDNGMLSLIVDSRPSRGYSEQSVIHEDWQGLGQFFRTHQELLCSPRQLSSVCAKHHRQLRPYFDRADDRLLAGQPVSREPVKAVKADLRPAPLVE